MGRVACYRGADSLGLAAQDILGNPAIDLAYVSGIDEQVAAVRSAIPNLNDVETADAQFASAISAVIPELAQVDAAVAQWWKLRPSEGYKCSTKLSDGWIKVASKKPHFDNYDTSLMDGPLTISLRLDTHASKLRRFSAKRFNGMVELNPGVDPAAVRREQRKLMRQAKEHGMPSDASEMIQAVGGLVIMMNHPDPSLHEVRADNGTMSLVATYTLEGPPERTT